MKKLRWQYTNRNQIIIGLTLFLLLFVFFYDYSKTTHILNKTTMKLKSVFSLESDYTRIINTNFTFKKLPLVCDGIDFPLLILVHSACEHFNNRKVIRETWGQPDADMKLLFAVGTPKEDDVQKKLEEESHLHNDMIQGSFLDTYHNLTYKHVMVLKYAVYHCPNTEFVLKVDDDVFVNIPAIKILINTYLCQNLHPTRILCSRIYNPTVFRSGKWATSIEDYPEKHYPTHCGGFAILYPKRVVSSLYNVAQKTKFFWVDDVFVSGICAKQSNISHIGIEQLVLSNADVHDIVDLSFTNMTKPFLIGRINLNEQQIRSLWTFVISHTPKSILDYLNN